jgi:hypothetical protein
LIRRSYGSDCEGIRISCYDSVYFSNCRFHDITATSQISVLNILVLPSDDESDKMYHGFRKITVGRRIFSLLNDLRKDASLLVP